MVIKGLNEKTELEDAKVVKIWGLQRTGSSATAFNFRKNTKSLVLQNTLGWKHSPKISLDYKGGTWRDNTLLKERKATGVLEFLKSQKINHVITIKNPFSWIYSYMNYRKKHGRTIFSMKDMVHKWNIHNKNYVEFVQANKNAYILQHENFIFNPEKEFKAACDKLQLVPTKEIKFTENRVSSSRQPKEKEQKFNKEYYLNKEYMKIFKKKLIDDIISRLDKSLVKYLDYNWEEYK